MTSLSDLDERSTTILSADVGWGPPPRTEATVDRRRASRVGAGAAIAICVAIAAIGWLIAPEGWVLGIVGLPATTFLAWRMGPGVVAADRQEAVARALGLTVGTILITDVLVVVVLICAAAAGMPGFGSGITASDALTVLVSAFGEAILISVIGVVVVGIPVSVVVFPTALMWAALVRFIVRC